MKIVTYKYEDMMRAGRLLNLIDVSGVDNVRALAELSYIIDSGKVTDREEREKKRGDGAT